MAPKWRERNQRKISKKMIMTGCHAMRENMKQKTCDHADSQDFYF